MYSKRHMRRLIKAEKEKLYSLNNNLFNIDVQNVDSSVHNSEDATDYNATRNLTDDLEEWANEFHISQNAYGALLKCLKKWNIGVPTSEKKTSNRFPMKTIKDVEDLEEALKENHLLHHEEIKIMIHQGLELGLRRLMSNELIMQFNYDGLDEKIAFKQYKNINHILFELFSEESEVTNKDFDAELRKVFGCLEMATYKKKRNDSSSS